MNNAVKYGFQKHLSSEYPSQIVVDITEYCNLRCIHCPYPAFMKSDAFTGAQLDVNLHKKLIDEVATDGFGICQYLRYTANGETLLHPEFEKIINYACKHSRTKINVTTNGMLLNEKYRNIILNAGVDVVDVSIDAFKKQTYSKIRVKGNLDLVQDNILKMLDQIKRDECKTKIVVSFVEQFLNTDETEDFEKFWKDKGAHFVVIRKLHSAGGAKRQISKKLKSQNKSLQRKPCLYPWERLVLTPTGEISFCPAGWTGESHFSDFTDITIKEAWKSKFMQELREAHISNNFSQHSFCENCPDWIFINWPNEGRVYADVMKQVVPLDLIDENL